VLIETKRTYQIETTQSTETTLPRLQPDIEHIRRTTDRQVGWHIDLQKLPEAANVGAE